MKGPEAERSSSLRYGALLGGRFELREVAGAGAMGIVHRAIDRDTGLAVAVKVLSAEGASDLARFEREARVLAELSHPHIVRYVGRGVSSDDRPYLVLEWLEGETLASRLGHVVPTIEETVALARVLAGAIEHARLVRVRSLPSLFTGLHERGLSTVLLEGSSEQTLESVDLRGPVAIIVGAEDRGAKPAVRRAVTAKARLPIAVIDSLNASVAAAVALYEVGRQRRAAIQ